MSLYSCRSPLPHLPFAPSKAILTRLMGACLFGVILLLTACETSTEVLAPTADETADTPANSATGEIGASASTNGDGQAGVVTEIDPYPPNQTTGPVRLQIPEIDLDVPIIAMGWRVDVVEGQRTTVWDVPLEEAGWHINSVGAGALGNTVVSGRQVGGAAVFAPLALGSVVPEQEILLTDGDGITFVYRVTEVTDPVAVTGATPEEVAEAATYYAPSDNAKLTLVTGWPEFTTTHRIFVVAEFVGVLR